MKLMWDGLSSPDNEATLNDWLNCHVRLNTVSYLNSKVLIHLCVLKKQKQYMNFLIIYVYYTRLCEGGGAKKSVWTPSSNSVELEERITNLLLK